MGLNYSTKLPSDMHRDLDKRLQQLLILSIKTLVKWTTCVYAFHALLPAVKQIALQNNDSLPCKSIHGPWTISHLSQYNQKIKCTLLQLYEWVTQHWPQLRCETKGYIIFNTGFPQATLVTQQTRLWSCFTHMRPKNNHSKRYWWRKTKVAFLNGF